MPERVLRLGIDPRPAVEGGKKFDGAADSAALAALGLNKAVLKAAAGVVAVGAAMVGASAALGRFAQAGGRQLPVQAAFARRVGDTEAALDSLSRATSGLVDDYGLMVQANAAFTLGAAETTAEMALLAEGATKMGRALGLDTAFALESLVSGLARGEREILDNLGLIVSQAEANRKYAAALGIAESALTDVQRKEAFRIEGMRQLREQTSQLGPVTLNAGDAFTELNVELGNTVDHFSRIVAQSDAVKTFFSDAARAVRGLRGDHEELNAERVMFLETGGTAMSPEEAADASLNTSGRGAGGATQYGARGSGVAGLAEQFAQARQRMEDMGLAGTESFDDMIARVKDFESEMSRLNRQLSSMGDIVPRTLGSFELATGLRPPTATTPLQYGQSGLYAPELVGVTSTTRPREEFQKWVSETADNLKPLARGAKDAGDSLIDFGGIGDRLGGRFNLTNIMENAAGNLLSGGISQAANVIADAIFGPGYETLLQENTRALRNMSSVLREQFFEGLPFSDTDFVQDLARRARFPADMDLTRRELAATDASPEEQFRSMQRLLMRNVAGPFAGIIATLNQQNVDEFITTLIASMRAGTFDADLLGNLSASQLLDVLAEMEGLADSTEEVADEMDKLTKSIQALNSPSGLNLALLGYNAGLGGGSGGSGGSGGDTRRGGGGTGGTGGTRRGAAVVINVNGAGDPRAVADEVVRRFEREGARGGPSALRVMAR